ncbi:hypothetical protein AMS68_001681 [Peltaster fructicola]|uniref:ATP-dependent RNA helicase n=1 Tax=Peltaster fructicola TaxID=286661 RepID=A0A6H0XN64_9PEZI|nr:hypothetical protein AMS68_001681 [Peltaster fructicola]
MAPLYQRYIPGARTEPAVTAAFPSVQYVELEKSDNNNKRKRKREPGQESKTSRKAHRVREESATVQDDTVLEDEHSEDVATSLGEPDAAINIRAGEFAHIKSSKKRHKLEKEARKARKQSEKTGGGQDEAIQALPVQEGDVEAVRRATSAQDVPAMSPTTTPPRKQKRLKQRQETEAEETEAPDDPERLKKHASLLDKFDKAQKRAAHVAEQQQPMQEKHTPSDVPATVVDPLVPIEIHTSMPEVEPEFTALPAWVTSAQRIAFDEPASFESLKLESHILQRLKSLDFHFALPVQQALLPALLPPSGPGSRYTVGMENLLPDLAVSAPTGSVLCCVLCSSCRRENLSRKPLALLKLLPKMYAPDRYKQLYDLAQLMDCPPSEDSPEFGEYVKTVDNLSDDDIRDVKAITTCTTDYVSTYRSAIDILVCTPGRLLEHLDNTTGFEVSHVKWLVLDEADKLLDEQYDGFLERLHYELEQPRSESQQDAREKFLRRLQLWDESAERRVRKVVLSATMTRDVSQLAALRLRRPQLIVVGAQSDDADGEIDSATRTDDTQAYELPPQLQEHCIPVGDGNLKPLYLQQLLESRLLGTGAVGATDDSTDSDSDTTDYDDGLSESDASSDTSDPASVSSSATSDLEQSVKPAARHTAPSMAAPTILIFVASTEAALRLSHLLKRLCPQLAHHITTLTKGTAMSNLAMKTTIIQPCIVIATDRAGRGLDTVSGRRISHVVQYDVPRSVVSYVHRVGRTARAGRPGQAWTLYTNTEARWFINAVTKAANIQRRGSVERVRFKVDEEEQRELYKEALASMRDIVFNSSRRN